jgi:hypothetical protein
MLYVNTAGLSTVRLQPGKPQTAVPESDIGEHWTEKCFNVISYLEGQTQVWLFLLISLLK